MVKTFYISNIFGQKSKVCDFFLCVILKVVRYAEETNAVLMGSFWILDEQSCSFLLVYVGFVNKAVCFYLFMLVL